MKTNKQGTGRFILAHYSALFGESEEPIRQYQVSEPKPFAQFDASVSLAYWRPRKRKPTHLRIDQDNLGFYVILDGGDGMTVIYDSRDDVPCDMDEWRALRRKRQPAIQRHAGRGQRCTP